MSSRNAVMVVLAFMIEVSTAMAADCVQLGDVSGSVGETRSQVTQALLASQKYSLRGGSDEHLSILNLDGRLVAHVRFRDQRVVAVEVPYAGDYAGEFEARLHKVIASFIGETGILRFDVSDTERSTIRFSSGNVAITMKTIPTREREHSGNASITVTVGEPRLLTEKKN